MLHSLPTNRKTKTANSLTMNLTQQDLLKGLTTIGLSMLINSFTDFGEYIFLGCTLIIALSLLLTELIFCRFKNNL